MTDLEEAVQTSHCQYNGEKTTHYETVYFRCSHPIHHGRDVYVPAYKCGQKSWCSSGSSQANVQQHSS